MATTYLTRTPSSASNRRTFTISTWVKKCNTTGNKIIFSQGVDNGEFFCVRLDTRGYLNVFHLTNAGNTYASILSTSMMFRDNNGYYHITVAVDTTQATASDRTKIYINGNLITDFVSGEASYPTQNFDSYVNTTNVATVGAKPATGDEFDGIMSHFHFIDGTAYQASDFGETDANGVWKIKTSPSVTYGTNGFFILKDGNSVTDQSGNGNNFTVAGGTLTKTEDNPSNVFAVGNALIKGTNGNSNGNLTTTSGQASWESMWSTLGASSGKWYAEFKPTNLGTSVGMAVGATQTEKIITFDEIVGKSGGVHYQSHGSIYDNNVETQSGGSPYATYTTNDIISVAIDLDNNYIYFAKNGTWQNSGDPTSGASGTGGISLTADKVYHFGFGAYNSTVTANFGNGYFATTAISSAGTNASGIGIFEYDVPTGYTALSTKGLNL